MNGVWASPELVLYKYHGLKWKLKIHTNHIVVFRYSDTCNSYVNIIILGYIYTHTLIKENK